MKLSVIMSAYDSQKTVAQAIESILAQTFGDFEFIIIDDGSKDNTADIIKDYQTRDKRIAFLRQENLGLTKSLNIGIRSAKGEYVARQDADDISLPERFKYQVELLDKNREIGFTGCSCEIIDDEGKFFDFVCIYNRPEKIMRNLRHNNIFCHGSMMFRRSLLERVSGYREFFKYSQDYDLYLRLIELSLPGSVNKILYRERATLPESISIKNIDLQAAYADLAKKCYKSRLLKKDDTYILNEDVLNATSKIYRDDSVLPFMESLASIKLNDTKKARAAIRPYLPPFRMNKYKLYLLWFFSYMPLFMREAIFKAKNRARKAKMALKLNYD
ncbi:MAG: glycosyltransferase [Candidatus Omnitrophica bacterium]|nr:glycosyltransferase [Candidatus Omnitrophota bacterium]